MWQIFQICNGNFRVHSLDGTAEGCMLGSCPAPRTNSDESALFLQTGQEDAAGLKVALDAVIGPDMKNRVRSSLHETAEELRAQYPAEAQNGMLHLAHRSISDLSDFMAGEFGGKTLMVPCPPKPADDPAPSATLSQATSVFSPGTKTPPQIAEAPAVSGTGKPPAQSTTEEKKLGFVGNLRPLSTDKLLDHEQLVQCIYEAQGLDLGVAQAQALAFLKDIGMRPHDMGVRNTDEDGNEMLNQCFYLSLARGYLGPEANPKPLALHLKRAIEASVLAARPAWASEVGLGTPAGEGVMAFADFLPIAMHAVAPAGKSNILAESVVCILDSVSGLLEVYIGPAYDVSPMKPTDQNGSLVLLWYTPGHYQCLVNDDQQGSKIALSYTELKEVLTLHGVAYIETTE